MASSDITIAQTGQFKHTYLLALVRWFLSSFWTSATLLLHRLVTAPLPPVPVFPATRSKRPASSEHLHPEPLVDCEVLHQPSHHTMDVIFVHGLYGSLGNTWRQGEWRSRYKIDPLKVPIRRPHSTPSCTCIDDKSVCEETIENIERSDQDEEMVREVGENIYRNIRKIIPDDNIFITEKFYNNTLLDQVEIVGNYETQAKFVRDLFVGDNVKKVDNEVTCEQYMCEVKCGEKYDCQCRNNSNIEYSELSRIENSYEVKSHRKLKCEVGCGCICDDCYSPCWPRDWIRLDHPGARVISINYTSDPHLWRPLWVKQNKRLQLHERAKQMMSQLLGLGVGERPIIWVGHSKGGLFIKQIYCEAYEAYMKIHKSSEEAENEKNEKMNNLNDEKMTKENVIMYSKDCDNSSTGCSDGVYSYNYKENNDNDVVNNDRLSDVNKNDVYIECIECNDNYKLLMNEMDEMLREDDKVKSNGEHLRDIPVLKHSSSDTEELERLSQLWLRSAGFMFYSVPHRGSPLADIKTPITARSIELMEICKDCDLVLSLQDRWTQATASSRPSVRSLVETCRTLMSVLWLRIVSVDSADPGIGSLYGVNVDHREICKPSSRRCLLYRELMTLMKSALKDYERTDSRGYMERS